jgi:hypothetical protein
MLDLRQRLLIIYQLPLELASSVPVISPHVNLDCSTLIQDQEDGDMIVTVDRVRPCPSGMNGHAHPRERRVVVVEMFPISFCERDNMANAG